MYTPLALLLSFGLLVHGQAELTVQTTKGPVVGFYDQLGFGGKFASSYKSRVAHIIAGVRAWLGIPVSKAPTGDLRFAPPVPADPWTEPLNANAFGPACIASDFVAVIGEDVPGEFPTPEVVSEDCVCSLSRILIMVLD